MQQRNQREQQPARGAYERTERTDGPIRWALNVYRLPKQAGAAIALQQRGSSIYVCVRKGEDMVWGPFQKYMSEPQLQQWVLTGGFPR